MRGLKVAVVRPPFLIDFPRRAHTRDEFGHEKSQPLICDWRHADMRLCVSPQILYDNDCFGRSVKPAESVRQSFFLRPQVGGGDFKVGIDKLGFVTLSASYFHQSKSSE
jgi:hypothetical protein